MYIALSDPYGQIVGTDNTSKLIVSIESSYIQGLFSPILGGTNQFYSTNGVFVVDGISFTGSPGYKYNLIFFTDGIDESKP